MILLININYQQANGPACAIFCLLPRFYLRASSFEGKEKIMKTLFGFVFLLSIFFLPTGQARNNSLEINTRSELNGRAPNCSEKIIGRERFDRDNGFLVLRFRAPPKFPECSCGGWVQKSSTTFYVFAVTKQEEHNFKKICLAVESTEVNAEDLKRLNATSNPGASSKEAIDKVCESLLDHLKIKGYCNNVEKEAPLH